MVRPVELPEQLTVLASVAVHCASAGPVLKEKSRADKTAVALHTYGLD